MYEKGKISVIAGRPGMGKTSFALKSANELQEFYGKNVLFINIEKSNDLEGTNGLIRKKFSEVNFHIINDTGYILKNIIQRIKDEKEINEKQGKTLDVVFIDYIQLISAGFDSRLLDIHHIFNYFRLIALELNIHIVLIAQCQRDCEEGDFGELNEEVKVNIKENTELIYVYCFKI